MGRSYFHLHLVSDSTGETLITVARAAVAQYEGIAAIEHVYPLVRSHTQLQRVLSEIEAAPGIVLYTLVEQDLSERLEEVCRATGSPHLSVLAPVHSLLSSYLGAHSTARPGAQHMLNAEYFKRIDAMNFTLLHDDGHLPHDLDEADVILVGVSRTSKTPTAIYLAKVRTHVELATSFFRPDVAGIICEQFRTLEDELRASVQLIERRKAERSFRVIDGGKESA